MVDPRRLIVSREIGSRPRWVIFTVRNAVFICGETEVMVPWMIVPTIIFNKGPRCAEQRARTILQFNSDRFVRTFHQEPASVSQELVKALSKETQLVQQVSQSRSTTYLTSFIVL